MIWHYTTKVHLAQIFPTFAQYADLCAPEWAAHLMRRAQEMAEEIEWTGIKYGPAFWRVCLTPVPYSEFKTVELCEAQGKWVTL